MAFVIVEGLGRFTVYGQTFTLGATEVPDDSEVAKYVRDGRAPEWVKVQDTRDVESDEDVTPPADVEEPKPEPYEKFEGRDGLWYFYAHPVPGQPAVQSEGYSTEEDVDKAIEGAKAEADKVPLSSDVPRTAVGDIPAPSVGEEGSMTSDDLTPDPAKSELLPCRSDDCDREFKNQGARTNHERVKHPEVFSSGSND